MKSKKTSKIISSLSLIVIGASIGFLAAKFGMTAAKTAPTSHIIAYILLFLPAFFLVVGFHEGGHAIAGKYVGFDFRMYVVGPFMWDKQESGWVFKWNTNVNLSGGMVICLPTTTENLAKRFSIYALGGPAASLVLTAITYGIALLISAVNSNNNTILNLTGLMFGLLSFLSFVIFAVTIIPLHTGGFYTDGARALRFLRGGDTARFELLLMKVITSSSGGIRPSLLQLDDINEALRLALVLNAPMKVYVYYFLYQYAFDKNDFEAAELYLAEYLNEVDSIPKGMRGSVYLEATLFYAYARKDLSRAESYLKQYQPSAFIPKAQVLITEAAIAKLNNDQEAVNSKLELAEKEIPNMLDRGLGIALREKLNSLKASN